MDEYIEKSSKLYYVIDRIVKDDFCIGCGLCAAICPAKRLRMDWSESGERIPKDDSSCSILCGKCLTVCPFSNAGPDQTKIAKSLFDRGEGVSFDEIVGYLRRSYVGYSRVASHRENGASGGLVTYFLEYLRRIKEIDGVISVIPTQDKEVLFKYESLYDIDSIRGASGSVYYPVDLFKLVRALTEGDEDKSFAVVVLPCRAYGLRLAMRQNPILNKRIKYLIGLTCGQLQNRYYTEYCCALAGIGPDEVLRVKHRFKGGTHRAGDFNFSVVNSSGREGKRVSYIKTLDHLWQNYYFTHRACKFCDDIFAETADIVFMDAWLPEYEQDPRGHSLFVVRNDRLNDIIASISGGPDVFLQPICIDAIKKSQTGVIYKKRHLLAGRLYQEMNDKKRTPGLRTKPSKEIWLEYSWIIRLQDRVMQMSKHFWRSVRLKGQINTFKLCMLRLELQIRLAKHYYRFRSILNRILVR